MATKTEIFNKYLKEYLSSSRKRKYEILTIVCDVTNLHRKSTIRCFRQLQLNIGKRKKKRGRKAIYGPAVISSLRTIWLCSSEICGELLYPCIPDFISQLRICGEWKHTRTVTEKLLKMSESTVKRNIAKFTKARTKRTGFSTTKPSHIKNIIPIFTGPWEIKGPGYGQVDTVVHSGESLQGDMIYTVNYTDIKTFWVSLAAQWNKGQTNTRNSLESITQRTPFPVRGFHPDTGSEFINYHIKEWCDEEHIELTRSRPYHKNDNAYVEQKNGHVVRRFLGYNRFDNYVLVGLLNKLYIDLELYLNHFVPGRKCIEKYRVGSRYRRKYDKAATPYSRVLACKQIDDKVKEKLIAIHKKVNPMKLLNKIDKQIQRIKRLQGNTD